MKILVTAFEPFGGEKINPSMSILSALPEQLGNAILIKEVLPVTFLDSGIRIAALIDQHKPDAVLSLGQAGGRTHLSVEKVGINFDHARIPDNSGQQPLNCRISEAHPDAYFTTLPLNRMVQSMNETGSPSVVSYTAGTYVCNHVMFCALAHIALLKAPIRSGFIHIPYLPEQVLDKPNQPSMSLDQMIQGILTALNIIEQNDEDISAIGGTTH